MGRTDELTGWSRVVVGVAAAAVAAAASWFVLVHLGYAVGGACNGVGACGLLAVFVGATLLATLALRSFDRSQRALCLPITWVVGVIGTGLVLGSPAALPFGFFSAGCGAAVVAVSVISVPKRTDSDRAMVLAAVLAAYGIDLCRLDGGIRCTIHD